MFRRTARFRRLCAMRPSLQLLCPKSSDSGSRSLSTLARSRRSGRGWGRLLHRAGDGALETTVIKLLSAGWIPPSVFRLGADSCLDGGRRCSLEPRPRSYVREFPCVAPSPALCSGGEPPRYRGGALAHARCGDDRRPRLVLAMNRSSRRDKADG